MQDEYDYLSRREILLTGAALAVGGCGVRDELEEEEMAQASDLVHLSAAGTLSPGANGSVNSRALINPYSLPMEVTEIKFQIDDTTRGNSSPYALGQAIGVRLDLGKIPLMNGFIPVSALCSSYNALWELYLPNEFTWKLKTPIFVPAGSLLEPTFRNTGVVPRSLNVRVSYVANVKPKNYRPKQLLLPWVSNWTSKVYADVSGTTYTDQSTESDLVNPFDTEIYLEKMVGRLLYNDVNLGYILESPVGPGMTATSIRLMHSNGAEIIPELTYFYNVFNAQRGHVNFHGTPMAPDSYFQMFLQHVGQTTNTVSQQAVVGLIGYREIEG